MGASYRVVAPYVTLKVKDANGADVMTGFYTGAVLSDVDEKSLKHHLDSGMVEKVSTPASPPPEDDGKGRKAPSPSSK